MKSDERAGDIAKAQEAKRKLELDRAKDKQAQLEKKKKLQKIDLERQDHTLKIKRDIDDEKKQLHDYQEEMLRQNQ